jgi:hypothetical protein
MSTAQRRQSVAADRGAEQQATKRWFAALARGAALQLPSHGTFAKLPTVNFEELGGKPTP